MNKVIIVLQIVILLAVYDARNIAEKAYKDANWAGHNAARAVNIADEIKSDLSSIESDVWGIESDVSIIKSDVSSIQNDTSRIPY